MTDPALVITAVVAVAASIPLLPAMVRVAARSLRRVVLSLVRPRPAAVLMLAASLARPAPAAGTTPPPLLRMPLPPSGVGPAPVVPVEAAAPPGRYVVAAGDSLWAIAARHLRAIIGAEPSDAEVDRGWRRLYSLNLGEVGSNPDLIFPGQQLTLPEEW